MADNPTKEQILEAVKASGYLMEQEVATLLETITFPKSQKLIVQTNRAYEDIEEAKSREIDVWAVRRIVHDEKVKLDVFVELICECKNNSNPFVFLGRPKSPIDEVTEPMEYIFPVEKYERVIKQEGNTRTLQQYSAFQHLELAEHHYYHKQTTKAVQFCRILRKGKDWEATHGGIYDAIFYPLVKAFLSRRREVKSLRGEWKYVWLFFPIVVLSGDIYYIDSLSPDPEPVKVSQVTLTRELRSKSMDGLFAIDFVTMDGLKDFIELGIIPFVNKVVDKAHNSPGLLLTKEA